jgi:hypothetical protein
VVNRWLEAGSGWSAPRRLKAGATSHGLRLAQRFPTRTSKEFLLHGLQVRILLGIAKKSRPTFQKPVVLQRLIDFGRDTDGRFCPVDRPKTPFDAQGEFPKLSSSCDGAGSEFRGVAP